MQNKCVFVDQQMMAKNLNYLIFQRANTTSLSLQLTIVHVLHVHKLTACLLTSHSIITMMVTHSLPWAGRAMLHIVANNSKYD